MRGENHFHWRVKLLVLAGLAAIGIGATRVGSAQSSPQAASVPLPETGDGVESLDKAMRRTLKEYGIPGGALAVAVGGKLVVAKGYGWANVAARRPVSPQTPFCLASVSKAVTAVAVLCLVQDGKLSLDERVYPLLGSPAPLDGFQLDVRIKQITLRQLLLHAGGFDVRKGGDYMHMARKIAKQTGHSLPIPDDWLIRYAFSRPLAFAPGTEEHYSNFGFFLCSEVIQRASGQTYEQYVRRRVLAAAGIEDMERERLGRHYAANEAHRYARDGLKEFSGGRNPIGPPAGSWIGSAVDMARFLTALDGSRGAPLLVPRVYREMLAPPPPPLVSRKNGSHFGLGWDVVLPGPDGHRFSKNGGVPGIHAYIEHLPGGVDWVVLLNGGEHEAGKPSPLSFCTQHVREAIGRVKHWPQRDLFQGHFRPPVPLRIRLSQEAKKGRMIQRSPSPSGSDQPSVGARG